MIIYQFKIKANKTQAEMIINFLYERGLRPYHTSVPLYDIEKECYIFYNKYTLNDNNEQEYYITDNIHLFSGSDINEITSTEFTQLYLRDKIIENILK